MKYGFEREFFVKDADGNYVLTPTGLPHDDCGFLAESRGVPQSDPLTAVFCLYADERKLNETAEKLNLTLVLETAVKLPAKLRLEAIRKYGKAAIPQSRGNVYGRFAPFSHAVQHAGLHVHFSEEELIDGRRVARMFDFVPLVQKLDKAFAGEIKAARRAPGYYEMKPYGVEYRSLPATVNPEDVARVLLAQ